MRVIAIRYTIIVRYCVGGVLYQGSLFFQEWNRCSWLLLLSFSPFISIKDVISAQQSDRWYKDFIELEFCRLFLRDVVEESLMFVILSFLLCFRCFIISWRL